MNALAREGKAFKGATGSILSALNALVKEGVHGDYTERIYISNNSISTYVRNNDKGVQISSLGILERLTRRA